MGTGFGMAMNPSEEGVIPRAVHQLFTTINDKQTEATASGNTQPLFTITAQFLEVTQYTVRTYVIMCTSL